MIGHDIRLDDAVPSDALKIAEMSRDQIEVGLGWSWTRERVLRAIRRPNSRVLKASARGQFAGFGIMSFEKYKANLNLLATDPGFRRQGIGKSVLKALESNAVDLKIADFYVQLRENNTAAQLFYQKYGYEMIDRNHRYYQNREAAIILYKYRPNSMVSD